MHIDIAAAIGATAREVRNLERDGKPAVAIVASRTYPTSIEDLWEAVTTKERLARWFSPVSGEFRPGGRFQIENNAAGEISVCEPPRTLDITWEFSEQISWVSVRLYTAGNGHARLELTHLYVVDPDWEEKYGPGAGGVGWDLGLAGLALHVSGEVTAPVEASGEWFASQNYRDLVDATAKAWGEAHAASGAPADEAHAAAARTAAFFKGEEQ
ncbi:SRPBCC family protein [Glycocaulis sp.]|uniref:SRPBCC family protein n=1 Tax=Glycocaulis sp. TaxID=1969725 RepID=UPI003D19EF04